MQVPGLRATLSAVTALAISMGGLAHAQLSNKPFSFNSSGPGGVGMSAAGKQAILNQELFGRTPDALLKDSSGRLLGFIRGPGRSVVVFSPSGELLPGYRPSFRNGSSNMAAGVFNGFFAPTSQKTSSAVFFSPESNTTDHVNIWTARILSGDGSASFGYPDSVTIWTGYVFDLDPADARYIE